MHNSSRTEELNEVAGAITVARTAMTHGQDVHHVRNAHAARIASMANALSAVQGQNVRADSLPRRTGCSSSTPSQ